MINYGEVRNYRSGLALGPTWQHARLAGDAL